MPLDLYLAYVFACILIAIIPGPTVTVIIANSLKYGTRAGLLNVAGTQLGLALMMLTLIIGLASVIAALGGLFDWLRYAGAAYLVWLGWRLLQSPDALAESQAATAPRGGFIPQFVDPNGNYVGQTVLLGANAMAVALVSDGAYAVLTGRAGVLLSRNRVRLVSRLSGACLIGGGVWLALTRAR